MHSTQRSKREHSTGRSEFGGPFPQRVRDGAPRIDDKVDDALPSHHENFIAKPRTLSPRRPWLACILLVSIGLLASAVLLGRVLALETSPWPRTLDLCSALFSVSCDPALSVTVPNSRRADRGLGRRLPLHASGPTLGRGPSFTAGHSSLPQPSRDRGNGSPPSAPSR